MSATGFQRARRLIALRNEIAIAEGCETDAEIAARSVELASIGQPALNQMLEELKSKAVKKEEKREKREEKKAAKEEEKKEEEAAAQVPEGEAVEDEALEDTDVVDSDFGYTPYKPGKKHSRRTK